MPSAGLFLFFLTLSLWLKDVNDGSICFLEHAQCDSYIHNLSQLAKSTLKSL